MLRAWLLLVVLVVLAACGGGTGTTQLAADLLIDAVADPGATQDLAGIEIADQGDTLASEGAATDPAGDEGSADLTTDAVPEGLADGSLGSDSDLADARLDTPEADACKPDCAWRKCGDDGCGGNCGFCPYGLTCGDEVGHPGECLIVDHIECQGRVCGPDNMGGQCPPGCSEGFHCVLAGTNFGTCAADTCRADCTGKTCGDDGCGNPCRPGCPCGQVCLAGACARSPCATEHVDWTTGTCLDSDHVAYCVDFCKDSETVLRMDCSEYPGSVCAWSPAAAEYACVFPEVCTPVCHDPTDASILYRCGDGGCPDGDLDACGSCLTGWDCTNVACTPNANAPCGPITSLGQCFPDSGPAGRVYYCTSDADPASGTLLMKDCPAQGKNCGYELATGRAVCQ